MKKLLRRFLGFASAGLLILVGVLFINTLGFRSRQLPVEPVELQPAPDGAVERLQAAVRLPTISQYDRIDTLAFRQLDTLLLQSYPMVDSMLQRRQINEFSLLYKWSGTKPGLPPVILMGHLDVVPVEEQQLKDWTVPPFSGSLRDNYLWGRGTLDDKINVLASLEAVEALLREGFQPQRSIYLAFGHDEETGGRRGAQAIVKQLQREQVEPAFVLDEGNVIVEEAMGGLDPPLAILGIAEKGYTTLRLTAKLKDGGHSSMPPPETAISVLSKAIHRLEKNPFPGSLDGPLGTMLSYAGPEMSFPYRMLFANTWLTQGLILNTLTADPASAAMVRTTTAPTVIRGGVKDNVLPTQSEVLVNFRILPGDSVEGVQDYVKRIIDDERILVEVDAAFNSSEPSALSDTEGFGFRVLQRTTQEVFPGVIVSPGLVIAATDSRHYLPLCKNIYRFMSVQLSREEIKGIHGIDERIEIKDYQKAIQWYQRLIRNSAG